MRLDKFTLRGQEAIQVGHRTGRAKSESAGRAGAHSRARCSSSRRESCAVARQARRQRSGHQERLQAAVARFPRVQGGQQYFSPRLSQIFTAAQKHAEKMQDEFISTEHLLLAIAEEKDGAGRKDSAPARSEGDDLLKGDRADARRRADYRSERRDRTIRRCRSTRAT